MSSALRVSVMRRILALSRAVPLKATLALAPARMLKSARMLKPMRRSALTLGSAPMLGSALTLALGTFGVPLAVAQTSEPPGGATRIVVGYAAGGAADLVARAYAEQLRAQGMGPVTVDNRPGASARLGLELVKNARPDGRTLYLGPSPLFAIFPLTYRNPGYDPDKDLRPVAQLVDIPTALVTGASQPYRTMAQYVTWAKAHPEKANLGVATLGSSGHLGTAALGQELGLDFVPVAYKGAAPMLVDVVAGELSMGWDAVASMMPLFNSGKIRFLGLSGSQRIAALSDVPTLAEQGFSQYQHATSWYGIFAPTATPDRTVADLERAFGEASKQPDLIRKLETNGLLVKPMDGAALAARIQTERRYWQPIVKRAGVVVDD